jgi:hypothetical protein
MRQRTSFHGRGDNPGAAALPRWWSVGIMVAMLLIGYHPVVSAAPVHRIAVVDFTTSGPLPTISGFTPTRFAADNLQEILTNATHSPVTVIPLKDVRAAESGLNWRSADLLSFNRLAQLAQRLGASHLFLGRIERLDLVTNGLGGLGGSMVTVNAAVHLQVFDAAQKRIAGDALGRGSTMGASQVVEAQSALHQAIAHAVAPAVARLKAAPQ